nr:atherin-like [Aegilops tauschii subsp. strangulata]
MADARHRRGGSRACCRIQGWSPGESPASCAGDQPQGPGLAAAHASTRCRATPSPPSHGKEGRPRPRSPTTRGARDGSGQAAVTQSPPPTSSPHHRRAARRIAVTRRRRPMPARRRAAAPSAECHIRPEGPARAESPGGDETAPPPPATSGLRPLAPSGGGEGGGEEEGGPAAVQLGLPPDAHGSVAGGREGNTPCR